MGAIPAARLCHTKYRELPLGQRYETIRDQMKQNLFLSRGLTYIDLDVLLSSRSDEDFKTHRYITLTELENFIIKSDGFVKSKAEI